MRSLVAATVMILAASAPEDAGFTARDETAVRALEEATGLEGRVQEYKVEGQVDSDWKVLSYSTTIGKRKVDRFPKVTVWKVRLTILKASAYPALRKFGLYLSNLPR